MCTEEGVKEGTKGEDEAKTGRAETAGMASLERLTLSKRAGNSFRTEPHDHQDEEKVVETHVRPLGC